MPTQTVPVNCPICGHQIILELDIRTKAEMQVSPFSLKREVTIVLQPEFKTEPITAHVNKFHPPETP